MEQFKNVLGSLGTLKDLCGGGGKTTIRVRAACSGKTKLVRFYIRNKAKEQEQDSRNKNSGKQK